MPKDPETAVLPGPWWFAANEVLAFLLELAALAVLSWWGFSAGGNAALRVVLGVGVPLAAIVVWGLFAAPKARLKPALPFVLLVKAVVLGSSAVALYALGHPVAAIVLAVVVVVNTAVAETFRRDPPVRSGPPASV
ncbi:YrdB family protein [Streptomyces sp. NPDC048643]|uniref:YrdB family protein n=1 Tax=Streptomyces sp. NPDC048643 TaxID=3155637 RepID=UPI003416535D